MQKITYKIKCAGNHPDLEVEGYLVEVARTDGDGVVKFAVRPVGQTWVVDHYLTGSSISTMGGATRKEAVQTIRDRFADYEERILRAQSFMEAINS